MSRLAIVGITAWLLTAAQGQSGSISGRVTDGGDGVLPGTTVTLTSDGLQRTAVADAAGRFGFDNLPPGTYRVIARLAGFLSARQDSIVVVAGRTTDVSLSLPLSFSRPNIQPDRLDPSDPVLARELYAIVFHAIFRDAVPRRLAVEAESIVPPRLIDEDWTGQLAGVPPELRAALAGEGHRRSVWHRAESFPPGTQFVPRRQIQEVFQTFGLGGWSRLPDRFGVSTYQAMTRVFVTGDRLHALLEYRHSCGSLCGEGALLWLSRSSADPGTPWTIRGRGLMWMS